MTGQYRNVFLSNIGELLASGTTTDLAIGQIGIFETKNYTPQTSPSTAQKIQIFQGTPNTDLPLGAGTPNLSYRTQVIDVSKVTGWVGKKAQKPQNMIVTIGYDGVDTSKTIAPKVGKDYKVFIHLSGQPISNVLGGINSGTYSEIVEEFVLQTPCADDCVDNCGDTVDCNYVTDQLLQQINERKLIGGIPLTKFIKATKLTSCDTPSGFVTVDYTKWTLTIADEGNQIALGIVQSQYPGIVVERVSRTGNYSTYELTLPEGETPDAFQNDANTVIPNCSTCPSGYTLVNQYNVFTIGRVDNGNSAALTTLASDYSAQIVTGSAIRLSFAGGFSVYQVYSTASSITAVAGDTVNSIGTVQSVCTLNTPGSTTAWTEGETCTKAEQTYQLILKNDPCGSNYLTLLQATYADLGTVTIAETNTDTCTTKYVLTVESSNTSCIECADQFYEFNAPNAFQGVEWTKVVADVTGVGCVCGVRLESAYVSRERKECFFDLVPYDVEPLFLSISSTNADPMDFSELCSDDFPVTVVQNIKYAQGFGSFVADQVKQSLFYEGQPWYPNPAERDALGYNLDVDLQGYYDQYTITFDAEMPTGAEYGSFGLTKEFRVEWTVYFPEGEGTDFRNAINAFLSQPKSNVSPISI